MAGALDDDDAAAWSLPSAGFVLDSRRNPRLASRRSFAAGALAALAGSFPLACDEPNGTGLDGSTGEVVGTVALAKDGAGVPNAIVALVRGDQVVDAAATGADGRVAFDAVAEGTYTLRLTGLELTSLSPRHTSFDPMVQEVVVGGGSPVSVVFAGVGLVPARITGVVWCAGAPVPDAEVRVVGGDTDVTVTTNAQGRYGATDLAAGHYAVFLATAPDGCAFDDDHAVADVRIGQQANLDFGSP